jgi:hypothetical protein
MWGYLQAIISEYCNTHAEKKSANFYDIALSFPRQGRPRGAALFCIRSTPLDAEKSSAF